MYNTLITNAKVINGLNEPAFQTKVAIHEDKIVEIGNDLNEEHAEKIVDAGGNLLTPGFIDPHASTGFGYFFPNAADHKLYQGITTEIFGNCGTSPGPIGEGLNDTLHRLAGEIGFTFDWSSLEEYFSRIREGLQFNAATLIGHSTLRGGYLDDWHTPSQGRIEAMKAALIEGMEDGALGLSSGLIYSPGCFAPMEELVELAEIVKEYGGIYASHIRNEREKLEEAVEEALTIGNKAGLNVLVSHLKAAEKPNWGKIPGVIKRLERYNAENNLQTAIDVYPYTAVSTKLRAFIPKVFLKDGLDALPAKMDKPTAVDDIQKYVMEREYDLDKMLILSNDIEAYRAKTVEEVAKNLNASYGETIAKVLSENPNTWIVYHCINEEDMDHAMLWDKAMVCTDSWSYPINSPNTIGLPHPRSYGAFTTFLERYVLQKKALSWEEAIHKMTYLPASFFNLEKRGQIKKGYFADLVVLNPDKVKANATYVEPKRLSEGVEHLWVNGVLTLADSRLLNEATGGKVLKLKA